MLLTVVVLTRLHKSTVITARHEINKVLNTDVSMSYRNIVDLSKNIHTSKLQ